jgi:hypothetical protein
MNVAQLSSSSRLVEAVAGYPVLEIDHPQVVAQNT